MISYPINPIAIPILANTDPQFGVGTALDSIGSAIGSAAWPSANRAILSPLYLPDIVTVVKLWVLNGATASGNIDVGIYREDFTRVVSSGTTAQSGTTAVQTFDITDTVLTRGRYYIAVAKDDAVGTTVRWGSSVNNMRAAGILSAATSFVLPATITPDSALASAYMPVAGISVRVTV